MAIPPLPAELWNMVCSFLEGKDVRNLRLVSKHLANSTTSHAFKDVTLRFRQQNFSNFRRKLGDQRVTHNLQTLVVKANSCSHCTNQTEPDIDELIKYWKNTAKGALGRTVPDGSHLEYRHHRSEPVPFGILQADYLFWLDALQNLPKLGHVTLDTALWFPRRPSELDLGSDDGSLYLEELSDEYHGIRRSVRQLFAICLGLQHSPCRIKTFEAKWIDWRFLSNHHILPIMTDVFKNLTSLHLGISVAGDGAWQLNDTFEEDADYDDFYEFATVLGRKGLSVFLASLMALESLKIQIKPQSQPRALWTMEDGPPMMRHVIPSEQTWPKLRELTLSFMHFTEDEFLDLLLRHRPLLKKLDLRDIMIFKSWHEFLPKLSAMRLEEVTVNGSLCGTPPGAHEYRIEGQENWHLWENGLAKKVSKYLVEGGEFPLTDENSTLR